MVLGGTSRLLVLCSALVIAAPSGALAQSVGEAEELYLNAEFEGAVTAFEAVLGSPDLSRDDALSAQRHLAALKFMLGDPDAAQQHAEAAAALDPTAQAPEGAPDEVQGMIDGAAGRAALTISTDGSLVPNAANRVIARLDPSPSALVSNLRLSCGDAQREGPVPSIDLEIEVGAEMLELGCEAAALTPAGAALFTARESFAIGEAGEVGEDDDGAAPIWPWLAVGGGAAAVAIVVLVVVATGGSDKAQFGPTMVEGWP